MWPEDNAWAIRFAESMQLASPAPGPPVRAASTPLLLSGASLAEASPAPARPGFRAGLRVQRSRIRPPRDGIEPDWASLKVPTQGLSSPSRFPRVSEGEEGQAELDGAALALEAVGPAHSPQRGSTPLARACAESEADAAAEAEEEERSRATGRHAVAWTIEDEDEAGAKVVAGGARSACAVVPRSCGADDADVGGRPSTAPVAPAATRPPTVSISTRPPTWRQPSSPWPPPPCAASARPMTATERWHQRDGQSKPAASSPPQLLVSQSVPQLLGRPIARTVSSKYLLPTAHANVAARPSRAPLRPRPEGAWGDVRPSPDSHRPWRAMLVGAHCSHYMEGGGGEKSGELSVAVTHGTILV